MPTRKSWESLPEWQFTEDNPNPAMRPSVDHLVHQLRKHKALRDHPDAVALVIKDLAHRYLVRDDQQPEILWDLTNHLMHQFRMATGFPWLEDRMDRQMRSALDRHITGNYGEDQFQEEGDATSVEPPVIRYTPKNWDVNFDDDFLKQGIQEVLLRHRPKPLASGSYGCYCKKFFSSKEEWAKHVRVRVWRFLKNEFPAIGSEDVGVPVSDPAVPGQRPDSNPDPVEPHGMGQEG